MLKLQSSLIRDDFYAEVAVLDHLRCHGELFPLRDADYTRFDEPEKEDGLLLDDDIDDLDDCPFPVNLFDEETDDMTPPPPSSFLSSVDLDDDLPFPAVLGPPPVQMLIPSVRRIRRFPGSPLNEDEPFVPPPPPPPFPFPPPVPIPPAVYANAASRGKALSSAVPPTPPPVSTPPRAVCDADGDVEMATDQEPVLPKIPLRMIILGDCSNSHVPPPFDFLNSVSPFKLQQNGRNEVLALSGRDPFVSGPNVSLTPLTTALWTLEALGPRTSALCRNTNRKNNPVRFLMRRVIWNGHHRMVRVAVFSRCGHGAYFVQLPSSDPRLELIDIRVTVEEFFQMQKDDSGRKFLVPRAKKNRTRVRFKPGHTSYFGPLDTNSPNPSLSFHQNGVYRLRFKLNGADIRQTGRNKRLVYRMGLIWFRAGIPVFYDQIFFQMKKNSIDTERKEGVIRTPIFTWASPRYDEGLGDLEVVAC